MKIMIVIKTIEFLILSDQSNRYAYMDVTDVNLFENLCHLYEISFYA